jgi:hypothetical protein
MPVKRPTTKKPTWEITLIRLAENFSAAWRRQTQKRRSRSPLSNTKSRILTCNPPDRSAPWLSVIDAASLEPRPKAMSKHDVEFPGFIDEPGRHGDNYEQWNVEQHFVSYFGLS